MNSLLSTSKKLLILLLVLSTTAIFHSCIKDQGFFNDNLIAVGEQDNVFTDNPKEVVITNIFGLVVDENDNPIANSEISLNTLRGLRTTTTDEYGNFLYTKVMVTKNSTLLKVRQSGKFEAFRKMNVTADSYNYTKIKLLNKNIAGSISAIEGGTIEHSSTAKVELPNNGVRYESGESYTGNVEVAMSWLDPTAEDLASRMIGDLSGIDEDGKQVALGTFGMLNVELLGENGEELQLKEGMPATLTFPVPTEILAQAPPTIPLWSFDEDLGTWVEEGFATLQGDAYVGEVAHFSSWNVDTKTNPISVSGEVFVRVNDQEFATPYLQVFVTIEGVQRVGGFLDDSGEFLFYNFPANAVFTLSILGNTDCGDVLWEAELGPYENDTDLGTIVIQPINSSYVTISGLGMDCSGNVVTDGYVRFQSDNSISIHPLEQGAFVFGVSVCDEVEGEISLVDLTNSKVGASQVIDISQEFVNAGILTACDELTPYLNIYVENEAGIKSFSFDEFSVSFGTDEDTQVYTMNISGTMYDNDFTTPHTFSFDIEEVSGVGIYDNENGYIYSPDGSTTYLFPGYVPVNIIDFGHQTGDIIEGTFEGDALIKEVDDSLGEPASISGSFRMVHP